MRNLKRQIARVFMPLVERRDARYWFVHGGRGSGKSHFVAEEHVQDCLAGHRVLCVREVQKTLKESAKRLIQDKIQDMGHAQHFEILRDEIRSASGGVMVFTGMVDHNAESIKSYEGFTRCWFEEAHVCSANSLELLRPTIRAPGSRITFTYNRQSDSDPVDVFSQHAPNSVVVHANWRDNPWFTDELEAERLNDLKHKPLRYDHIWDGGYQPMATDAIWTWQSINSYRRHERPQLDRIVIGVDPAASSGTHGIVAAGRGARDGRGYVLEDGSLKGTPYEWSKQVVALYDFWGADRVTAEVNQGGDMVKHTIRTQRSGIPISTVRATRGKHVRAEPIASLYAMGRVSHVGTFPALEQQMVRMTADGYDGDGSPDRCDALVWALTDLFPSIVQPSPDDYRLMNEPETISTDWA